jgi:hypothetical protein
MMTLTWESPIIQFTRTASGTRVDVSIPEAAVRHRKGELPYWTKCRQAWRDGGQKDVSAWRKYHRLVESERYHFAYRKGGEPYGFAEGFTALALERNGFKCWSGVHLFGKRPVNAKRRVKNTRAVEELLKRAGFELPRELSRQAKNPDIVAYHKRRNEWRFCEVKRREQVQRGQIIGLAILHLLTGAPVAVVRLSREKNVKPRHYHEHFLLNAPIRVGFKPVRRR